MQNQHGNRTIFGFPVEGFGLFQSLLLAFASVFFTFFASTAIAIFSLLAWNIGGGHTTNYADSYLYVGLPAAIIVLLIALPYFLVIWFRAKLHK